MKKIATIEARMTSSRLPGKILMESCGKSMLELMIERVKKSRLLDDVVLATTVNVDDDPVVQMCERIGCHYFRGSEDDVLLRVLEAAKSQGADVIVELTGDCPCIDWRHIDQLLEVYMRGRYDFVANNTERSYPDGFDIRIFSVKVLEELNEKTKDPWDHEHVSIYFPRHPEQYKCYNQIAEGEEYRPELEITLDEMGDYKLINSIFTALYPEKDDFTCRDVIRYLDAHKELLKYTEKIKRTQI